MPRRKSLKPTLIYWLVDVRPETIASGWHAGKPFYCGKTTQGGHIRLLGHKADARRKITRKIAPIVIACGEHLQMTNMEAVPADGDWIAREKFWIAQLRLINPECANVADGGQGMTGYITSAETRQKQSVASKGRIFTPEHREKLRLAKLGKTLGPEARRKVSDFNRGKVVSEETREKLRLLGLGRKHTSESRAKMSATQSIRTRQPHSDETKRKIGDANRGRRRAPVAI